MNEEQKELFGDVQYRMNEEGFEYCFDGYSSWAEISDPTFIMLRAEYLESVQKLKDYINLKADE